MTVTARTRLAATLAGAATWIASAAGAVADEARRPNILLIVADDLGYGDVGFQGGSDIPTPNLDALARGGVRFTNGYVSGPYCSPTRAGLLTGRYQQRFGHEFNPGEGAGGRAGLPLSERTIADRIGEAGYATGLVGKWHLGASPEFHPQRRGFDEFFGFLGGAHTYFPGREARIYRGADVVEEPAYLTDAFGREAVTFIDRHKDHPFFLYLAFNAVHTPMDAPDARRAKFSSIEDETRQTYAAMLSALDESVGKVIEALRASGLEEDTLILFLSDNGGPTLLGTSINGSRNDPLRGSKRTTLEGGVRVPFVLSWKGRLPAGTTRDAPVIQLDVLPTALAAAGVETDPGAKLDGVNLLPYATGESAGQPHDALYWRFGEQLAVRRGDWKLVRYDRAVDIPGARSDPRETEVTPPRLYNLADDPGEAHDLSASLPETVAELQAAWQAWDAELVTPAWGPTGRRVARSR